MRQAWYSGSRGHVRTDRQAEKQKTISVSKTPVDSDICGVPVVFRVARGRLFSRALLRDIYTRNRFMGNHTKYTESSPVPPPLGCYALYNHVDRWTEFPL